MSFLPGATGFPTPLWRGYKTAPKSVQVTFHSREGTPIPAIDVPVGETMEAPPAPTREGHAFAGWFTDEAASLPPSFDAPITGRITLFASWTLATVPEAPIAGNPGGTNAAAHALASIGARDNLLLVWFALLVLVAGAGAFTAGRRARQ